MHSIYYLLRQIRSATAPTTNSPSHLASHQQDTMEHSDPPPPLPTPNTALAAVKQVVTTTDDAPDGSPVKGESPLPPSPLFARPHSLPAEDNIFDDSGGDECLAEVLLPQSTSSLSRRCDGDDEDADALESPQKRTKTAPDLSSPLSSMSKASLPSNDSTTPVIQRIGNIPTRYLEFNAEDEGNF